MICRNNTRERIDQLSIRIQLIEGLSVKYSNAVEFKGPGHSSGKQCLSKRKKFYKQDSANCEDIKATETSSCMSKTVCCGTVCGIFS